ncbi:MAG: OmpA family protein [Desulfobacteraceae bacterium]|nr:MAG: OmpA family protein [Desulfobacteraceae bacterium]
MLRYFCIGITMLLLVSCGTKTTVVLLPEDDGTTGSVVVKSQSDTTTLDEPYTYTQVKDDTSKLTAKKADPDKINQDHQALLKAEPLKPVSFILYFKYNSTELTDESLALIPKIIETAKEREPCEINVIGHTDSKGDADYNYKLALERAQSVGDMLKETDLSMKNMTIQSFGENDPLIVTSDNVSEDKNRRVEIMIR